jgi:hypothetical protein
VDETSGVGEPAGEGFWLWLGFWIPLVVLGLLAVIGAAVASACRQPGDYVVGLSLSLAAIALGFLWLKHRLDGGDPGPNGFLFVEDMQNLALAIPLFALIGLLGLFLADSWEYGSLHAAGLGLFAASCLIVFLDIKHVYDRLDSLRP